MARRGFTLVELLIVIVVIGILSAMMMLSSTEVIDSAKVAGIVSDMRNIRTAATLWYLNNPDKIETNPGSLQYSIKTGTNGNQDIQTYFAGYTEIKKDKDGNESISVKVKASRQAELRKYLDGGSSLMKINANNETGGYGTKYPGDYGLINNRNIGGITSQPATNKNWYVSYRIGETDDDNPGLQAKLKAKAQSLGLLGTNGKLYTGGKVAFMHVLKLAD